MSSYLVKYQTATAKITTTARTIQSILLDLPLAAAGAGGGVAGPAGAGAGPVGAGLGAGASWVGGGAVGVGVVVGSIKAS